MIKKINIKSILSVFCITLGIVTLSSIKVYAGSTGTGTVITPPTEGGGIQNGTLHGHNDGTGSGGNSGGSTNSGTSKKNNGGNGGNGDSEKTPVIQFYDKTDDWGSWNTVTNAGYYEDEFTYVAVSTETLDITKPTSTKKYDWTLDYKQMKDDTYKQIEHKVNGENDWLYKVEKGGYYKMGMKKCKIE